VLGGENVAVQCPHMLRAIVDDPPPGLFVVLMRRPLADIHASERRILWQEKYRGNTTELRVFGLTEGDSAQVKYDYWDSHEKSFPYVEVQYGSLQDHPLHVPAELRKRFHGKQTAVQPAPKPPAAEALVD
jgi:hypothetical protein